jgi:L-rhamnose mutarotase
MAGSIRSTITPEPPPPWQVAEYKRQHDEQWPEVHDALRSVGVRNLSIFHLPAEGACNRLFLYMEYTSDIDEPFEDAMKRYSTMPRVEEWEKLMRSMQVQLPGSSSDLWWQKMACLFHQD